MNYDQWKLESPYEGERDAPSALFIGKRKAIAMLMKRDNYYEVWMDGTLRGEYESLDMALDFARQISGFGG